VTSDGERNRQSSALRDRSLIQGSQITRGVKIDACSARRPQHHPAAAQICAPGLRIAREVDAGGNVRCTVESVLKMDGQSGQIGIRASQHLLMDRGFSGRHFDRLERHRQPPSQFVRKPDLAYAERAGQSPSRSHDVADKLRAFRPDIAKPYRLRIAVKHPGYMSQSDRLLVDHALAHLNQILDETSQAKPIEIWSRP
jgi:hypothetical protein